MPSLSDHMILNTTTRKSRLIPMLIGTMLVALAGTANAQNALGDGSALDANTGQSGSRNYTRPDFTAELRFRNAIATGNAPGGLSFRGDLGYRAAGEFSADLGSDSLFAFRRDSLYSGLAGMGIRGTDALQYQFALTTGSAPPRNLMGSMSVTRDGSYSNSFSNSYSNSTYARPQTFGQPSTLGVNTEPFGLDGRRTTDRSTSSSTGGYETGYQSGSMLGTLRSSSTYATTSSLQPALLSVYTEGVERNPIGLVASPLLGIISTPMKQGDMKTPNPLVARPSANIASAPIGSTRLVSSYDGLVEQMRTHIDEIRERGKAGDMAGALQSETNDAWLIRQMQDLREKLYGMKPADSTDQGIDGNTDSATDPEDQTTTPPIVPGTTDPINTTDQSPLSESIKERLKGLNSSPVGVQLHDPTQIAIDPETLEVLRGTAATEIKTLYDPGAEDRDIYAEHITAGQRMIKAGRYFDAEERFTHALSVRPEDIPSQLGRIHAQIGAGMVLSASVNLQALFSLHPEVVASRYSGNLLPAPARIETLISRLKERSGITRPELSARRLESDRVRVSSALLLAYLGYQIDDQELVTSGLQIVDEWGSESDRRFASLLSQLWAKPTQSSRPTNEGADDGTDQE